jgi:hypothetical protein
MFILMMITNLTALFIVMVPVIVNFVVIGMVLMLPSAVMAVANTISYLYLA